jgi:hypothetical protein
MNCSCPSCLAQLSAVQTLFAWIQRLLLPAELAA